jgi:hypothetical protein
MVKQKLNSKILEILLKIYSERNKNSIQARLSQISNKEGVSLATAAEIMARQKNRTVGRYLENGDKDYFKKNNIKIDRVKKYQKNNKEKIIHFVNYETNNFFLKGHVEEINKCYTAGCYTASFILIRKVVENLITEIIKRKFPEGKDKSLYLNFSTGHVRDLSEIIKTLKEKSNSFAPDEKKLIQRILDLSDKFKNNANDKTHSLYHICKKKELDDASPQLILDLIKEFFKEHLK